MSKAAGAFRTISEVAETLGVQPHVIRFWETKFSQVKPVKRAGGRRYYRPADVELLGGIRALLHDDGMTIKGVQKLLREDGVAAVAAHASGASAEGGEGAPPAPAEAGPQDMIEGEAVEAGAPPLEGDHAPSADASIDEATEDDAMDGPPPSQDGGAATAGGDDGARADMDPDVIRFPFAADQDSVSQPEADAAPEAAPEPDPAHAEAEAGDPFGEAEVEQAAGPGTDPGAPAPDHQGRTGGTGSDTATERADGSTPPTVADGPGDDAAITEGRAAPELDDAAPPPTGEPPARGSEDDAGAGSAADARTAAEAETGTEVGAETEAETENDAATRNEGEGHPGTATATDGGDAEGEQTESVARAGLFAGGLQAAPPDGPDRYANLLAALPADPADDAELPLPRPRPRRPHWRRFREIDRAALRRLSERMHDLRERLDG
ncbi:MAG: MerR family transcriptional regulator [Hasllibacter sp.]